MALIFVSSGRRLFRRSGPEKDTGDHARAKVNMQNSHVWITHAAISQVELAHAFMPTFILQLQPIKLRCFAQETETNTPNKSLLGGYSYVVERSSILRSSFPGRKVKCCTNRVVPVITLLGNHYRHVANCTNIPCRISQAKPIKLGASCRATTKTYRGLLRLSSRLLQLQPQLQLPCIRLPPPLPPPMPSLPLLPLPPLAPSIPQPAPA